MAAFDRLPPGVQFALSARVAMRKHKFEIYKKMVEQRDPQAAELVKRLHTILLIGDRPAPDAPKDPKFHFTPFGAHRHSSLWLNMQLEAAEIKEQSMIWINAYDFRGEPNDSYWLALGYKKIIALGNNAEKWIKSTNLDVPYAKVQHPQAWKRFHGSEPYPLLELLK